ncbi:hypothetical protein ACFSR9_02775 [Deinococcus taklimakanensis]|uniref:Outer membrane protein beta-barrel domain-containing protein n=1 Tax=Deinococcus taklimakanensis TaxID=536443 RepID=A0ABW5NZW6_9DEIO
MNKLLSLTTLALITAGSASAQSVVYRQPLELGLTGGYAGGLSGEAFVHAPNVAGSVGIKAGVAVSKNRGSVNFKNINPDSGFGYFAEFCQTIGCRLEGTDIVVSLDGTYNLGEFVPGVDVSLYAGPRYGIFTRNFAVSEQDGSLTFDSKAFGLGAGVLASYALTPTASIIADLGANHFFNSPISFGGSNTPSETVDPSDPSHKDLREFSNMPGTQFKARVGVKFGF